MASFGFNFIHSGQKYFFHVFRSLPTRLSPHLSHSAVLEHGLKYGCLPVYWSRESRDGTGDVLRGDVQS